MNYSTYVDEHIGTSYKLCFVTDRAVSRKGGMSACANLILLTFQDDKVDEPIKKMME